VHIDPVTFSQAIVIATDVAHWFEFADSYVHTLLEAEVVVAKPELSARRGSWGIVDDILWLDFAFVFPFVPPGYYSLFISPTAKYARKSGRNTNGTGTSFEGEAEYSSDVLRHHVVFEPFTSLERMLIF
jgi:hypothetical protein